MTRPLPPWAAIDRQQQLSVMATIYGVAMVLGYEQIAESFYSAIIKGEAIVATPLGYCLTLLASLCVALLGFRFFWAVGNIRRYLLEARIEVGQKRRAVVIYHAPILLFHAFLFYCLCRLTTDTGLHCELAERQREFLLVYELLLLTNSLWLTILLRRRRRKIPEIIWRNNNLAFSSLVLVLLISQAIFSYNILFVFIPALAAFFLNSLCDLRKTSHTYAEQ
jgi:hypothetical protein